jgi:hypothetical protein
MGAGASANGDGGPADQEEIISSLEHIRSTIQHLHQAHTMERELTNDFMDTNDSFSGRHYHHLGGSRQRQAADPTSSASEAKFDPTTAPRTIVRRSMPDRPPVMMMGSSASSPALLHRAMIPDPSAPNSDSTSSHRGTSGLTRAGGSGVGSSSNDARLGVHHGVTCDGCGVSPIRGLRFKCGQCVDYDLCRTCYRHRADIHEAEHSFRWVSHNQNSSTSNGSPIGESSSSSSSSSPNESDNREDYNEYAVAMTTSNNARQLLAMSAVGNENGNEDGNSSSNSRNSRNSRNSLTNSPSRLQRRLQRRAAEGSDFFRGDNHATEESAALRQFYCHQCNHGFTLSDGNATPQCTECNGCFVESWDGVPASTAPNTSINFQRSSNGRLQRRRPSSLPSVQEVERVLQELQMLQQALTQRGDLLQNALREQAAAEEKNKPKPARPDAIANLPIVEMKPSYREKASHCSICLDGWTATAHCHGKNESGGEKEQKEEETEEEEEEEEEETKESDAKKKEKANVAVRLGCSHFFHKDCIVDWLKRSGTCPICRTRVKGPNEDSDDDNGEESKVDFERIVQSNSAMMRYHLPSTAVSLWERGGEGIGSTGSDRSGSNNSSNGYIYTVEEARRNAQTMVRNG